jgi:hypothetical protein
MENQEKPNYYGIIPASVRYDQDISSSSKLFYAEISALANVKGICWASNKYFANLYGVQPTRISVWVKELETKGYIRTKTIAGGYRGISLITNPYGKAEAPLLENQKHNKQTNNKSYVDLQNQLLVLVNEITGRSFRTLPDRGVKKTLDAFTMTEIERALRGLMADDWHSERIKEFKIDYLIRATTIDKFLGQVSDVMGNQPIKPIVTIANQDEMVRRRLES